MEGNEKNTQKQAILCLIPEEILNDVPERKKDEFCRGLLRYLGSVSPALYREAAESPELSSEVKERLTSEIHKFFEIVKKKKEK